MIPNDISPTFCILPWIHLSTRPNGHLRLCCTSNASSAAAINVGKNKGEVGVLKEDDGIPSNLGHHDMLSSWNNKFMKTARLTILKGGIPSPCVKCFREEQAGHRSKRIWETKYWSERLDVNQLITDTKEDGSVPEKIYYFDIRMGTKCDLKCIMCSPHDSSMWIGEWGKMYSRLTNESLRYMLTWRNKGKVDGGSYRWHKTSPQFFKQLYDQVPHMRQLYMAGGEALIIREYEDLLDKIIEMGYAKQIELRYNSNGLRLTDKLIEKWRHFKEVRFHFSLDSIEEMNTYIRWPTDWNIILKQLRRLDDTDDNIEVTIACSAQILNIYYIPEFIKWKLNQGFKKVNCWPPNGDGLINFHLVYHPAFLNLKCLPQWFKDKTAEKYEDFYGWLESRDGGERCKTAKWGIPRLKGLISFMNSGDWSNRMPEFVDYINVMDGLRKTDFRKTFPEMEELLHE